MMIPHLKKGLNQKNKRAVSEIISAVIIISVVVAGLGLYTSLSQQRIIGDFLSVKESIELSQDQIGQSIETMGIFNEGTDVVSVFIFNSGISNMTIGDVFVNGTKQLTENQFYLRDMSENIVAPNNKTIPKNTSIELILNFTGDLDVPADIENIVIRTDTKNIIEVLNND